jgi:hypothetical protein
MINQMKSIQIKTISWYIFVCVIGFLLYTNIIAYWLFYIQSAGLSGLFTNTITGNIFAAMILASILAFSTKLRSFLSGFSIAIIIIIQVIVMSPSFTDLPLLLWKLYISEYLTFILSCGVISHYYGQIFHVKNT